ncbi:hypothetical protein C1H46_038376 [Malus baccata]|uniref:J domain-containing protein n=1 Tax=Malus baccata TaxID=106549 RepID=A0A540KPG1_MALBA|nr:hypothetical protein C1H46_038376 [Malus baccata]
MTHSVCITLVALSGRKPQAYCERYNNNYGEDSGVKDSILTECVDNNLEMIPPNFKQMILGYAATRIVFCELWHQANCANAQEKFMRIKHAYNTLLSSKSRGKYDSNFGSDYSYSSSQRNQSKKSQDEEFYGFEDFFKDIQEEFKNWEASASSQGKPKSLWEELGEIGEEFVEFLEKELNITDPEDGANNNDEGSSGKQRTENVGQDKAVKESSIEDNIDEIEATLAQLKKELGL